MRFRTFLVLIVAASVCSLLVAHHAATAGGKTGGKFDVYIGTYTQGKSKGIYLLEFDSATGALTSKGLAVEMQNPSFLAIHPKSPILYAVNETGNFQGENTGAVSAFAINAKTGKLSLLNQQPSGGAAPCHLVVDKTGKNVLVANYMGGSIASLPVSADGRLGAATSVIQHRGKSINPKRQEGPHAHAIHVDPANRYVFAVDLGLDKVLIYRFDADKGTLTPHDPPAVTVAPGAGPRHFTFHPNGKVAYVINELNSTLTVFGYDAERGVLRERQTVLTVAKADAEGNSTAEVVVHPSGKFLYGSNRGHDSIVVFTIDQESGRLTHVENQTHKIKTPRNFAIDPTGSFLLVANQGSDNVIVFRIDEKTGSLQPTPHAVDVPTPVCIRMKP